MKIREFSLVIASAVVLFSSAIAIAACPTKGVKELTGAGATFPYPLYSKMFSEYNKLCNVKVNYQSIGSGGGIRQLQELTVDFGGSTGSWMENKRLKVRPGQSSLIPRGLGQKA